MGRGTLPISETLAAALEELGRQVAAAVARREFDRARQLTEHAIRLRASETPADDDVLAPIRAPAD